MFFRVAHEKIRLVVFICLFVGVVGYTYAVFRMPFSVANIGTPSPDAPAGSDRWYVVIASVSTVAEAAAKVFEAKANGFDQAEYVLQPQSRFIAVIMGKNLTTAQAIELKSRARQKNAPDPFLWPFKCS